MSADKEEYESYKLILCGDVNVGKSHLFERVVRDKLPLNPRATIGVHFGVKPIQLPGGDKVKCCLWDTAGQEKFRSLSATHFRRAHGGFLVYDLTNQASFRNAAEWLASIRQNSEPDVDIMLVGNKYDLVEEDPSKRQVPYETAAHFAQKSGISFIEVSAVSTHNVDRMMTDLLQAIHEKAQRKKPPTESPAGGVGPAGFGEAGRTRRLSEGTIRLDADNRGAANVIRPNDSGCCALG